SPHTRTSKTKSQVGILKHKQCVMTLRRSFCPYLYLGRTCRPFSKTLWTYATTNVVMVVTGRLILVYRHVLSRGREPKTLCRSMYVTTHGMSNSCGRSRRTQR